MVDKPQNSSLTQPDWDSSNGLGLALSEITYAANKKSSARATSNFLYAVGNDHAGTYFPIVLTVTPYIETILRSHGPWSQRAILEALIDLYGSFEPEPSFKLYDGVPLADTFKKRVLGLKPHIESIAQGNSAATSSARELLTLL